MDKKGLVLGGGGSRGAYQIGVWKALRELGWTPQVVTGTSVGALNGALMVQDDYDLALQLWENIKTSDVLDLSVQDTIRTVEDLTENAGAFLGEMVKNGGADPGPLEEMIRACLDEEKVRSSATEFGLVTVELQNLVPKPMTCGDIPQGRLLDYLMASAACFPAMKARVIDQKAYIDGGFTDNLPVGLAVELGADDIIAVDLDAIGVIRRQDFPGVRVRHLRSRWDLGVFLLFDKEVAARNMRLGYLDTLKLFGKREGAAYTFLPGEADQLYQRVEHKADLILAKSDLYLSPGNFYPAQARAEQKIRRLLACGDGTLTWPMAGLAACEAAARLLRVTPLEEYTAKSMERALLSALKKLLTEFSQLPEMDAARSVKALTAHLQDAPRRLVLAWCIRLIRGFMAGRYPRTAMRALCSAATEEFIAAFYLCALQMTEEEENPAKNP